MNMMNTKHLASGKVATLRSPLPWSVREHTPYPVAIVSGNKSISEFHLWDGETAERVLNIVKACNAHFKFKEVLRDIGRQSIAEDWTPNQAMRFVVRSVRLVLAAYYRADDVVSNSEHSCYWPDGVAAYCQGDLRKLPRFFKSENCGTAKAWLAGWDYAQSVNLMPVVTPSVPEIFRRDWSLSKTGSAYYPLSIVAGEQVAMNFHSWDESRDANARFIIKALSVHATTLDLFNEIAAINVDELALPLDTYKQLKQRARALLS